MHRAILKTIIALGSIPFLLGCTPTLLSPKGKLFFLKGESKECPTLFEKSAFIRHGTLFSIIPFDPRLEELRGEVAPDGSVKAENRYAICEGRMGEERMTLTCKVLAAYCP